MKKVEIVARDKNGVELGRCDSLQPETIEEVIDNFDHKEVIKLFWAAFVIKEQARLRAATNETTPMRTFKKLTAAEKEEAVANYLAKKAEAEATTKTE